MSDEEEKGNLKGLTISFIIIIAAMIAIPYGVQLIITNQIVTHEKEIGEALLPKDLAVFSSLFPFGYRREWILLALHLVTCKYRIAALAHPHRRIFANFVVTVLPLASNTPSRPCNFPATFGHLLYYCRNLFILPVSDQCYSYLINSSYSK